MKIKTKTVIILLAIILTASAVYYSFFDLAEQVPLRSSEKLPPYRLIQTGPFGENITITEQLGDCTLKMKAKKLYLKKTRALGFSSALFKQVVAKGLNITIINDNQKILELYKDRQSMKPGMKNIRVDNPKILHPKSLKPPKSIAINKERQLISFLYKDKTDVWDLKTY